MNIDNRASLDLALQHPVRDSGDVGEPDHMRRAVELAEIQVELSQFGGTRGW